MKISHDIGITIHKYEVWPPRKMIHTTVRRIAINAHPHKQPEWRMHETLTENPAEVAHGLPSLPWMAAFDTFLVASSCVSTYDCQLISTAARMGCQRSGRVSVSVYISASKLIQLVQNNPTRTCALKPMIACNHVNSSCRCSYLTVGRLCFLFECR